MKKITFLLSYFNQKTALEYHIKIWKKYPVKLKQSITFQIIDDCSKKNPAIYTLRELDTDGLNIDFYRVCDDLYCNIAGARNLGSQEANTEWLLVLDMDTVVTSKMATQLLELIESPATKTAYQFNRCVIGDEGHPKNGQRHPAVCLIKKADYWNVGGCEEDLVGHYGQTDPSFWYKAKGKINRVFRKDIVLDYLLDGEANITRDTSVNLKLFNEKKRTGKWSTNYVRFNWEKISIG